MENVQKFQELLKELFQFEASDLDFGIYRVLNYKRDQIKKFVDEDLVNKVDSAFTKHKDQRLININQTFEEVKEKIIQSLGKECFTPSGELKEQFKDTPLGKDYLSIKSQKEESQTIDEIKLQVFNDLYSFFSRFYEEGDFVPQYRHSIKSHKYAIPYDGEEVKLYWANNEQYYIKTGLLFRDYTFRADSRKITFRTVSAKEELGSKKATKERFFVLDDELPIENVIASESEAITSNNTLITRFQYRELSEKEVKKYQIEGGRNTSKQEKINQRSYEDILKKVEDINIKALLSKEHKNEKPLLLYQISRFTAKNTRDYFIHKNLKKFLTEQLDYFIKAEVLSIETLEKEKFLDKHITRAKVVREIGEDIIDFLSQIEDFQKRLWEKKKFVLKTEYVITTDRVPEEFYDEIWKNKEQKRKWKELGFDSPKNKEELKKIKLPIDTRYFSQEFKEKLLEKLTEGHFERSKESLDDLLDGLLIKSENYHALNLLINRYKGKVKCVYIDPPFNTGSDEFIYRDKYQHSSWISMMDDRLDMAKKNLENGGAIFVSIDDNEVHNLKILMFDIFKGQQNSRTITVKMAEPTGVKMSNVVNEGGIARLKEYVLISRPDGIKHLFMEKISKDEWDKEYKTIICNVAREDIDELKVIRENDNRSEEEIKRCDKILAKFKTESLSDYFRKIGINDGKKQEELLYENSWRIFRTVATTKTAKDVVDKKRKTINAKYFTIVTPEKKMYIVTSEYDEKLEQPRIKLLFADDYLSVHPGDFWSDIKTTGLENEGKVKLKSGKKPEKLLKRIIEMGSNTNNYVLDFFLGSGTATAVAQKLGRKWLGIEIGTYFEDLAMKRMKYVLNGELTGVSKDVNWQGGGLFKYQILEQYEDTLDNIELTPNKQAELKFGDDYLLKYFLDYETRENPSLLNIEHLKNPFAYKLKVSLEEVGEPQEMFVDIPETFNYLLGLKVKRLKVRNNMRKYLFVFGEKEGKDIAVVWREYDDKWSENDFKKDKEFIIKELETWIPDILYVNGQSVLTPKLGEHSVEIRYIEPEFKKLMG